MQYMNSGVLLWNISYSPKESMEQRTNGFLLWAVIFWLQAPWKSLLVFFGSAAISESNFVQRSVADDDDLLAS